MTTMFATCLECGEIAEIRDRFVLPSTDGPIEHVQMLCVRRHSFVLPAAHLDRVSAPAAPVPQVDPVPGKAI